MSTLDDQPWRTRVADLAPVATARVVPVASAVPWALTSSSSSPWSWADTARP